MLASAPVPSSLARHRSPKVWDQQCRFDLMLGRALSRFCASRSSVADLPTAPSAPKDSI